MCYVYVASVKTLNLYMSLCGICPFGEYINFTSVDRNLRPILFHSLLFSPKPPDVY